MNNFNNFRPVPPLGGQQKPGQSGYPSAPRRSGGLIGAIIDIIEEASQPSAPAAINPYPPIPKPVQVPKAPQKPAAQQPKQQPKQVKAKQPEKVEKPAEKTEKAAAPGYPLPPNGIVDAVVWSEIIGTPRYKVIRQKRQERERLAIERLKAANASDEQEGAPEDA